MQFESVESYKSYLGERLNEISKQGDFDIYLHLIDVFNGDNGKSNDEIVQDKALSILVNGLYLNRSSYFSLTYSSLNATSIYACSSSNPKLDEIIDYSYNINKNRNRAVVLIAIPKKVGYKGNEIEFSSIDGVHQISDEGFKSNEMLKEMFKGCSDFRFTRMSLMDCTLSYVVPKEYILGVQKIMPEQDKASFIESKSHICNMTNEQRMEFDKNLENKLESIGLKENGENAIDIMAKKSKEDNEYNERRLLEEF